MAGIDTCNWEETKYGKALRNDEVEGDVMKKIWTFFIPRYIYGTKSTSSSRGWKFKRYKHDCSRPSSGMPWEMVAIDILEVP